MLYIESSTFWAVYNHNGKHKTEDIIRLFSKITELFCIFLRKITKTDFYVAGGYVVGEQYEEVCEKADKRYYEFEVEDYREAKKNGVELKYVNTSGIENADEYLKEIAGGGYDDVFVFAP